jgi:RNA polymerase sigma-70 factor, ECF subfamily
MAVLDKSPETAAPGESILRRIAFGDPAAVQELVSTHGGLVRSLARRLSPVAADAEDAMQEILLDVWKCANRFDATQGSEKVFIATIARRRLIDRLRRNRHQFLHDELDALDDAARATPGDAGERAVEAERAAAAINTLRPLQRQIIELSVVDGLSQLEIAGRLGLPLGTVKTLMRRGFIAARQHLGVNQREEACA